MTLDEAPLGPPPVLLPAAIFRQHLYDPTEFTPEWAKPRSARASSTVATAAAAGAVANSAPTEEPKLTPRAQRPKTNRSAGTAKRPSKRAAKPKRDAGTGSP